MREILAVTLLLCAPLYAQQQSLKPATGQPKEQKVIRLTGEQQALLALRVQQAEQKQIELERAQAELREFVLLLRDALSAPTRGFVLDRDKDGNYLFVEKPEPVKPAPPSKKE